MGLMLILLRYAVDFRYKKRMLTCGDQIHSEPLYCWGWSVPQASVDSDLLHKITLRVAHAAKVSDKGNILCNDSDNAHR